MASRFVFSMRAGIVRSRARIALPAVTTLLMTGFVALGSAWAGIPVFDELIVSRGVERVNGAVTDSMPYFFEVCISGPDISDVALPTVQTPPSPNFPGGSMQTLTEDGDEFCFDGDYASEAAREADFPNGSYTVSASNGAQTLTDSKQVSFDVAAPSAYPGITAPTSGATVSTTVPTSVTWSLVDKGGCNLAMPGSCLDLFVVSAFLDEPGMENEVDFQLIMNPAATETTIDGSSFSPGLEYFVEVESIRGALSDELTDTLGQDIFVALVNTDINGVPVSAAPQRQPIEQVFVFKGFDRNDGVPVPDSYFIEICVLGMDIPTAPVMALPTVETPASTNLPAGSTESMSPADGDEFCFEAGGFASAQALADSYPMGNYTVTVTDTAMTTDTAVVDFTPSEPSGFPDVFDPSDGAMVPSDQDLLIQWGDLTATDMSCNPVMPSTCADGLQVFLIDENTDSDVTREELAPSAGAATIPASVLQPDTPYGLEVESYRGTIGVPTTSSTLGNPIFVTTLFEDINSLAVTTVPEAGSAALGLAALLTLKGSARRRSRRSRTERRRA